MCVRADYKSNLYPPLHVGIFKQTMIHKKLGMDKDYLATKAIPFLFPLAVEPGLNLSQVTVLTYLHEKPWKKRNHWQPRERTALVIVLKRGRAKTLATIGKRGKNKLT